MCVCVCVGWLEGTQQFPLPHKETMSSAESPGTPGPGDELTTPPWAAGSQQPPEVRQEAESSAQFVDAEQVERARGLAGLAPVSEPCGAAASLPQTHAAAAVAFPRYAFQRFLQEHDLAT